MSAASVDKSVDRETLDRTVGVLRPRLHRYCARMTGSAVTARTSCRMPCQGASRLCQGVRSQSRGLAVSHRPQCGDGSAAATRPTGSKGRRTRKSHMMVDPPDHRR